MYLFFTLISAYFYLLIVLIFTLKTARNALVLIVAENRREGGQLSGALYFPPGGQDEPCGACRGARDTWAHLWCCPTFEPLWTNMVELVNTLLPEEGGNPQASYCSKFVFLGVLENGHALPRSLALLHMLMWKFVIQELMSKSQVEHYVIDAGKTSTRALRRYLSLIHI